MIKWVFRIAVFSVLGVLMMPGNEVHRDQAIRSAVAAYANAVTYCDRHAQTCERLAEQFNNTRIAFAYEAADLSKSLMRSTLQQSVSEDFRVPNE